MKGNISKRISIPTKVKLKQYVLTDKEEGGGGVGGVGEGGEGGEGKILSFVYSWEMAEPARSRVRYNIYPSLNKHK